VYRAAALNAGPLIGTTLQRVDRLVEVNRFSDARDELHAALAIEPRAGILLTQLAYVELCDERFEESARIARESIEHAPWDERAYRVLAAALTNLDRYKEAADAAREAVMLAPDIAETHITMASVYIASVRNREAEEAIDRALMLDPTNRDARLRKAILRFRDRDKPAAERILRELLAEDPNDPAALHWLGLVVERKGASDEARDLYIRASAADPRYEGSRQSLAKSIGRVGVSATLVVWLILRGVSTAVKNGDPLWTAFAALAIVLGITFIIRRVIIARRLRKLDPAVSSFVRGELFGVRSLRRLIPGIHAWWIGRTPLRAVVARRRNMYLGGYRSARTVPGKIAGALFLGVLMIPFVAIVLCVVIIVIAIGTGIVHWVA
jgi:tetratricopeptide (TPR) repeat protein